MDTDVHALLRNYRIDPDTERGQHFLADGRVVEEMVAEAELAPGETVLEIGAGLGVITRALAGAGVTVHAYENDPDLLPALRSETTDLDNVTVHEEDVLDADLPAFDACVSNIPFHLSTDILELLCDAGTRAVLLVQEEFAARLVAEPGDDAFSRTTLTAQFHFIPVRLRSVDRTGFEPEMGVDAALVKLFPRDPLDVDPDAYHVVAKALWMHPGKKVRNAFVDSRHVFDLDKDGAKAVRDDLPHADTRVNRLDVHGMVDVAAFLAGQDLSPA